MTLSTNNSYKFNRNQPKSGKKRCEVNQNQERTHAEKNKKVFLKNSSLITSAYKYL